MNRCWFMRFVRWVALVGLVGCGSSGADSDVAGRGGSDAIQAGAGAGGKANAGSGVVGGRGGSAGRIADGNGSSQLQVPRVYPLVRASTPSGLVANDKYRLPGDPSLDLIEDDAGTPMPGPGSESLARVVQERLYSMGPTELLRIISELDTRTATLDTDATKHACLAATPVARTLMFPGGQSFKLQLQCLDERAGSWMAFGFGPAESADADAGPAAEGRDFYLMQGQDGGMGGAYHVHATGAVEAWITVADSRVPNNSQVLMHLLTDKADGTCELTFGGSGVGFCGAHLKTGSNYLFISGKTNAPPPAGAPNGHYCASTYRQGCFATTALSTDLGGGNVACKPIDSATFALTPTIDASSAAEGNVAPAMIYKFFDTKPEGISAY